MGLGAGLISIGIGDGLISIGIGAGLISIGTGLISIGIGDELIITIDAGDPESITLLEGVVRVSSPTPIRASSRGRGDGETFGPLL